MFLLYLEPLIFVDKDKAASSAEKNEEVASDADQRNPGAKISWCCLPTMTSFLMLLWKPSPKKSACRGIPSFA